MISDQLHDLTPEDTPDTLRDAPPIDVPVVSDTLPDGTPILIAGDVAQDRQLWHPQGDNIYGFGQDCGLASSQTILQEFGHLVSETDVVTHAAAFGECEIDPEHPDKSGGSDPAHLAKLLGEMGVPSDVGTDKSLESLAERIEGGHGTIICVNAGVLWDDHNAVENGQANHAVVVIGVARDQRSGEVVGFYVNDTGRGIPSDAGRFVSADLMEKSYIGTGGACVMTEGVRSDAAAAPSA